MKKFCARCGKQCPEGTRFCTSCGNLLANDRTVNGSANTTSTVRPAYLVQNEKKNNNNLWIVVVLLLILIVIAVLLFVLVGFMRNNTNDTDWEMVITATDSEGQEESEDYVSERYTEEKETSEQEEITTEYVEYVQEEPVEKEKQADWIYTNARFGYSVLIPSGFSQSEEEPDNGDGAWLYNEEGASLTVSGHYNVLPETPESIVEYYPNASYSYVGDNYCCVSFVDDNDIVYIAQRVELDLVYGFEIIYPEEDGEHYDSMIEDMLDFLLGQ